VSFAIVVCVAAWAVNVGRATAVCVWMRITYTVLVTGSAVFRAVAVGVRLGVRLGDPLITSRVAVAASLTANAVRVA
jgi:hypothetical protein